MARVLIVDDDAETCELMTRFLRTFGHEGEYVTSGGGALARLKNFLPDLMILDVMMPGMDGFQVLSRVRANPRFDAVNVVMYSADSDPRNVERAKRLGAQDYLVKGSVGLDVLETVVEQYG